MLAEVGKARTISRMTNPNGLPDSIRSDLRDLRADADIVMIGSPATALLSVAGLLGLTDTDTLPEWDPDSMCRRLDQPKTPRWDAQAACFIAPTRGDYWYGRPSERAASIKKVVEILVGRRTDPTVVKRVILRSRGRAPRALWPEA